MFYRLLITFILGISAFSFAVENSIVDRIERFESLEELSPQKYSKNQFSEIAAALNKKNEKLRIASYNVLFNLYDHNLEECYRWPQRLPRIVALLNVMQPDILGVQELYPDQWKDLSPFLSAYQFYAKPALDGELNGIFFRKDRFELVDQHVWYMTETPDIPSSDTLTLVKLKDRKTGKQISILNTHLAFSKIEKRDFQVRFITKIIKDRDGPLVFMGDLNTFPQFLDIPNLPFYDGDYVHSLLKSSGMRDAKEKSLLGHLGPLSTFTNQEGSGEPFKGKGTPGVFLDHIYVKGIKVLIHAVDPATVEGYFPSDHMPILVDLLFN